MTRKWRCPDCGSTEVHVQAWLDANTNEVVGETGAYSWCCDCDVEVKSLVCEYSEDDMTEAKPSVEQLLATLAKVEAERDEARAKSSIDERQCDEMTEMAGRLATQLTKAEAERDEARADAERRLGPRIREAEALARREEREACLADCERVRGRIGDDPWDPTVAVDRCQDEIRARAEQEGADR